MNYLIYQIRKCLNADCYLRYPVLLGKEDTEKCPRCRSNTEILYDGRIEPENNQSSFKLEGTGLEVILDNIRSTWNVGSMFRTADGVGMRHLYLCGITPTPDNSRVAKTSLGAETTIPWTYHADGVLLARSLKEKGAKLWALEGGINASAIEDISIQDTEHNIVLVVGNEISGVDPGILELCEKIWCIPMRGVKRSLNAAVAFGIAAYFLTTKPR